MSSDTRIQIGLAVFAVVVTASLVLRDEFRYWQEDRLILARKVAQMEAAEETAEYCDYRASLKDGRLWGRYLRFEPGFEPVWFRYRRCQKAWLRYERSAHEVLDQGGEVYANNWLGADPKGEAMFFMDLSYDLPRVEE